jgi:hypothetical protein
MRFRRGWPDQSAAVAALEDLLEQVHQAIGAPPDAAERLRQQWHADEDGDIGAPRGHIAAHQWDRVSQAISLSTGSGSTATIWGRVAPSRIEISAFAGSHRKLSLPSLQMEP